MLRCFSQIYVVKNDLNKNSKLISCFKEQDKLTVFKIQNTSGNYITAKLVKGDVLYTDVRYLAVSYNKHNYAHEFDVPPSIESEREIKFSTMERNFFGRIIIIKDSGIEANRWCNRAGYDLAQSEHFGILWPPTSTMDDVLIANVPEVIVFASFNLKPRGNIKIHSNGVEALDNRCYRLEIANRVKVFHKNTEAVIEQKEESIAKDILKLQDSFADKIVIDSDMRYFSFSCDGVTELANGVKYLLFGNRRIKGYRSNYPVKQFIPFKETIQAEAEIIEDAKKVYHSNERFVQPIFSVIKLSSLAESIVAESDRTGYINSAVKRLIEGGKV
jgi:hypothetical protein